MQVAYLIEVEILRECRMLGQLARERLLAGFADMSEQANRVQAEALGVIRPTVPRAYPVDCERWLDSCREDCPP